MGIVHHSNYPIWFEAGRTDFIKKLGMPYTRIEESGTMLPLIELRCRFMGVARYEDEVMVVTCVRDLTDTRITFGYEVYREGEKKPITSGETMHAFTDGAMRPVNLKKHAPDIRELLSGVLCASPLHDIDPI